jgi:hypothetical protein
MRKFSAKTFLLLVLSLLLQAPAVLRASLGTDQDTAIAIKDSKTAAKNGKKDFDQLLEQLRSDSNDIIKQENKSFKVRKAELEKNYEEQLKLAQERYNQRIKEIELEDRQILGQEEESLKKTQEQLETERAAAIKQEKLKFDSDIKRINQEYKEKVAQL